MTVEENVSLAGLTTFRLGGPARYFARVQNVEELKQSLDFARDQNLATLILGGGSNVLIDDKGFDGLVIKIEITGVDKEGDTLVVGAGENWDALVARAVAEGLWGVENLSGIPGTVGGAVVQGVGAYGAAVGETLLWAESLDRKTGGIKRMSKNECAFGYRDSFFKHDNGRHVVLRAAFALSASPQPNLSYKDLEDLRNKEATLELIRKAILAIRKDKFPDITKEGTAGSFFKNLILPESEAKRLQARYPKMPLFAMPETAGFKVPLAWFLDHIFHVNGVREGGVRFFERQPLVIVADFGASSREVLEFKEKIKKLIKEKLDIEIEEEVRIIF